MPFLVSQSMSEEAIARGFPSAAIAALVRPVETLCGEADARALRDLEGPLQINRAMKFTPTSPEACAGHRQANVAEILLGGFVDDPDKGMDVNLPDEYDPQGDRKYLGGGQGFRHVYFQHWNLLHPITTFHLPPRALGMNPTRMEFLTEMARTAFAHGEWKAIHVRVLSWALHYLQDLTQPFHVVETPSPSMVAWYALWGWPPSKTFPDLERETARSVTNYHWAVEGYVRNRLMEVGESNPFAECLTDPGRFSTIPGIWSIRSPSELANDVVAASVRLAPDLGRTAVAFFGHDLTLRDKDFTKGSPQPAYSDMAIRPDLVDQRLAFHEVVCHTLANAALASRWLITYALTVK
jgi:hypothetical protein